MQHAESSAAVRLGPWRTHLFERTVNKSTTHADDQVLDSGVSAAAVCLLVGGSVSLPIRVRAAVCLLVDGSVSLLIRVRAAVCLLVGGSIRGK